MPAVSLVVPFNPDGALRSRNWDYVRARYERLHPDWEIIVEGCPTPEWRKGIAVNRGVQRAAGKVVVVADADCMLAPEALLLAVEKLREAPWVIPHRMVYRLSEAASRAVMADRLSLAAVRRHHLARFPFEGPAGGGFCVARRQDMPPMDERFVGWGGEDISFARSLDTLVGSHARLAFTLWHLHHIPMPRRTLTRASAENEAVAAEYLDANGHPVEMAKLCERRPYEGLAGGGVVVAEREAALRVPLDERFAGWGHEDFSYGVALECLLGAPYRGSADLVHLAHTPAAEVAEGRGSVASRRLRDRYLYARRNPEAMRALLEESHAPV